jgi:hypothetical protein
MSIFAPFFFDGERLPIVFSTPDASSGNFTKKELLRKDPESSFPFLFFFTETALFKVAFLGPVTFSIFHHQKKYLPMEPRVPSLESFIPVILPDFPLFLVALSLKVVSLPKSLPTLLRPVLSVRLYLAASPGVFSVLCPLLSLLVLTAPRLVGLRVP